MIKNFLLCLLAKYAVFKNGMLRNFQIIFWNIVFHKDQTNFI